jgi:hypothetical protein
MQDKTRMLVPTYEITRPSSASSWADTGDAHAMLHGTTFDLHGYDQAKDTARLNIGYKAFSAPKPWKS